MNLSNSEIGSLLNMSTESVKNAKHRLKKKLKIEQEEDLYLAIVND
jgi:DNA-binding CsgD family transcriptional regulator